MIKVGTCGQQRFTPPPGWRERHASRLAAFAASFPLLELNSTFYRLPRVSTAERWRTEAPESFEFTLKAWQAITHPADSPTWRSSRLHLDAGQRQGFGFLRLNDSTRGAWAQTMAVAAALRARVCLLQTPARFGCTEEHRRNLRSFLETVDRGGLTLAWEPRGDWHEHPPLVAELCRRLDLVHVVDPLRREPLSQGPAAYLRLHGLNRREHDYDYDYSEEELRLLLERLCALERRFQTVYCLFNNFAMYANAARLLQLLGAG